MDSRPRRRNSSLVAHSPAHTFPLAAELPSCSHQGPNSPWRKWLRAKRGAATDSRSPNCLVFNASRAEIAGCPLFSPDLSPPGLLRASRPRPAGQFQSAQHTYTAKDRKPVTERKRNIPSVFNKCSRPRLDIRNSAAILRAVNRSNHKRPGTSPCSNEYNGKPVLARTPKIQKPDRIRQIPQSNFLYY